MKVLLVHNFYQIAGGEDSVFAAERQLLLDHGHEVETYTAHNDDVDKTGRLALAANTIWNRNTTRDLGARLDAFKPDVVHFHNTLPIISPSAYYAAASRGIRVVQTLHNYRLFCPTSLFLRDGKVCEECLGKSVAWPAIKHACYRESRSASSVVAGMLAMHKALGTYTSKIDSFIALTEFSRNKFIEGGLPPEKIVVKPHFTDAPQVTSSSRENAALFVGRLSNEKGILTLLEAWQSRRMDQELWVVGDGPLVDEVLKAVDLNPQVKYLGRKSPEDVQQLMMQANMVIVPSECYETFGRVIMEAYACATPVVVSDIGAVAELVHDGVSGYLFKPGEADRLADAVEALGAQDLTAIGKSARNLFETYYTADSNYEQLMSIYRGEKFNNRTPEARVGNVG